jgi:hypothetical protein
MIGGDPKNIDAARHQFCRKMFQKRNTIGTVHVSVRNFVSFLRKYIVRN